MTITNHTAKGIDDRIEALTAGLPQNIVRALVKTVTASEIKALKDTPIELIPAPGDGNLIILNAVVVQFLYGSLRYVADNPSGTVVNISYGIPDHTGGLAILNSSEQATFNNLLTFAANQHGWFQPADEPFASLGDDNHLQISSNIMLGLYANAGPPVDFINGDGTLVLTLLHSIVPVA